ncbi:hypothetical protein TrST_g3567 [Triparma strigata]|uniref:Alpha/beta hydrolase fold-5 domain-containing protein n=1 Tax=Triparma strigata TaxID=1606541 RepID=A0A9W7C7A0_9STRA|nr:hypothetical protein TrST_g3567 [Triparma strigata]
MKSFITLLLLLPFSLAWDDVILSPPEGKNGEPKALYFAQGADISTDQYSSILSLLQEKVSFPLWVGIPQCPADVAAIPFGLSSGISRIQKAMTKQGMPSPSHSFYAGHSLGGAMMPDYVASKPDEADAMFLLGSFITRKYKTGSTSGGRPQVEFPVPTLTVGGELDGLCRISRIVEALYTQVTFDENPDDQTDYMPVTVIEGMNHMQFASGEPPSFVKSNDIQSELSEDDAHAAVTDDIAAFLEGIVSGTPSDVIRSRVKETVEFVKPITEALLIEGYEQFLPPCYCETEDEYGGLQYGTCESTEACNGGVRWTGEVSQHLMAGLDDPAVKGLSINAVDSIHLVTEEKPSCHLPHIHGNPVDNANPGVDADPLCESPDGCTLELTTVTQPVYENSGEVDIWRAHFSVPWVDTGFLPITANELKTKIKSRQAIFQAAGLKNVSYVEQDASIADGGEGDRCGEINQKAIDWALEQLPEKTRERYETYGQKLMVGPDIGTCKAGPCWIWDPLRFKKDDDANTVNVQAVYFATENKNSYPCGEGKLLPCSAGFHYCKLLSPARALEWMYVDGLKNVLGLDKE